MAFVKDTIKLGAAREVFSGIEFVEIKIGASVVGYRAILPDGNSMENTALTALCRELWQSAFSVTANN